MVPRILIASLLCLLLLPPSAVAYPTRAGHCESGAQIGEASGGVHGRQGSGSLDDGNFTIRVNGTRLLLNDETAADGTILELMAGENYTVMIEGNNDPFRGVLLRVAGINGEDMVDTLAVVDDNTQLLPSTGETSGFESACADDVSGLCHNSRMDKMNITAMLMLNDDEDADVLVEVTIVTNNDGGGSNDWYYGSYQLNVTVQTTTNSTTNSTTDDDEEKESSEDESPPGACKWYCSLIPTPWLSEEPDDYPKCDWTYSCSACDECETPEARLR